MKKLNVGGAFILIDAGWKKVREALLSDGATFAGLSLQVAGPITENGFPAEIVEGGGYMQEWFRDGKSLVLLWIDAEHIWAWSIDDSGPMALDIQTFLSAVAPKS